MFMDEQRCTVGDRTRQLDLRAFGEVLSPALFRKAAQAAGVVLRKGPLNWANMAWLGIAAATHTTKSFADILVLTFRILEDMGTWPATTQGPRRGTEANAYRVLAVAADILGRGISSPTWRIREMEDL